MLTSIRKLELENFVSPHKIIIMEMKIDFRFSKFDDLGV